MNSKSHRSGSQKQLGRCVVVRLSAALLLLTHIAGPSAAKGAIIWTGPPFTFSKDGLADPTQATNQDRITPNVWITRGEIAGIYNARTETNFTHYFSPADTEWANGTMANYSALTYTNWNAWALDKNGGPPNTIGVNAVVHLISENIYIGIKFTSWSGVFFSYQRSTPNAPATPPGISHTERMGTNIVVQGTNGGPGQTYFILASTNILLPMASWRAIATNTFDTIGNFAFTNPIAPSLPGRFYRLRVP